MKTFVVYHLLDGNYDWGTQRVVIESEAEADKAAAVREAVEREREEIAKWAEEYMHYAFAERIRARGKPGSGKIRRFDEDTDSYAGKLNEIIDAVNELRSKP